MLLLGSRASGGLEEVDVDDVACACETESSSMLDG